MRLFVCLILFVYSGAIMAGDEEYLDDVWIDASSTDVLPEKGQTIYFDEWNERINQLLSNNKYSVALRLNHAFDPLPFDDTELPSLGALGALNSDSLLGNYFSFLENFGRTHGIDYLVLPETSALSQLEKEVLLKAHEQSPFYFVSDSLLSYHLPASKKEYVDGFSTWPKVWVVSENQEVKKVQKWDAKFLDLSAKNYLIQLIAAKSRSFEYVYKIPNSLEKAILLKGTYAIDGSKNLPLTSPQITYLGQDDQMKFWLKKYASVHTQRMPGLPTIVDARFESLPMEAGDIVLTTKLLSDQESITQIILPFQDADFLEIELSKMLFGVSSIAGNHHMARAIPHEHYLGYSTLENEGMSSQLPARIDSILNFAITKYTTPGMQVAVARNGSIVYQHSSGYFTYDSMRRVNTNTIYDLASLTKVMATLPAIALLVDRNQLSLDDSLSYHLPEFIGSNKSHITIRQLLAHNGGLKSYAPFWKMVLEGDRLDAFYYKTDEDEANDIRSYGYEPDPIMQDTLKSFLVKSDLNREPEKYKYSDLGFMILHLLVEKISGISFNQFLREEFYDPMGLTNTLFNPYYQGRPLTSIAPTEYDHRFRGYQVWGEVHDRNATIFGGVAGHAGLFSNASDLAKLMSMFLNGGVFGGKRYLSQETVEVFNKRYFEENRRGLGWDKIDQSGKSQSHYASDRSFGHTGFTGTMVWADPEQDLIIIFLSNRIYPNANNKGLARYNIRGLIRDRVYESIEDTDNSLKLN